MRGKVQKWGNSLAIRIPRLVAQQAGLEEGSVVEVVGSTNGVTVQKPRESLEELVSRITPENRHGETDWGPPVGNEVW